MPYRTVDLCAGIGGIRRGFERTGSFWNVCSSEIDKYACRTYEHLYVENPKNDITSEEFKEIIEVIDYEVLLAGFPCQTFSRAGLQEGFANETRGIIFEHIAEIISRTRPRGFFLENVDHLINHDKGETFKLIIEILEDICNYKIIGAKRDDNGDMVDARKNFVRNSKHFGVPQNRPRTYIMGFDRARYNTIDLLDDVLPKNSDTVIYNNLNDVIEHDVDPKYYLSQGYFDTLVAHKQRQINNENNFGYKIINEEGVENPVANTLLATGGSGKERNLIYDVREGIPGMRVGTKNTPLNDRCIRVLTPTEWGKLQGFINYAFINENGEDGFSFPEGISDQQKYKQFGNSVTIPLVEEMARFMLECFRKLGDEMPE